MTSLVSTHREDREILPVIDMVEYGMMPDRSTNTSGRCVFDAQVMLCAQGDVALLRQGQASRTGGYARSPSCAGAPYAVRRSA